MAGSSDEELSKEYINSIMAAVPDVALMVPRTRPIKTYALGVGASLFLCPGVASFSFGCAVPRLHRRSGVAAADDLLCAGCLASAAYGKRLKSSTSEVSPPRKPASEPRRTSTFRSMCWP